MKLQIKFRNSEQETLFNFLLKIAKNTTDETYFSFESRAKAVLMLPSICYEMEKTETFKTDKRKNNAEQFLVTAEFWLRTVFLKLEPEKIIKLLAIGKAEARKKEKARQPFDFLLICMATEPDTKQYAFNKSAAKQEEKVNSISFEQLLGPPSEASELDKAILNNVLVNASVVLGGVLDIQARCKVLNGEEKLEIDAIALELQKLNDRLNKALGRHFE